MINLDMVCLFKHIIKNFPECIKKKQGTICSQYRHPPIRESNTGSLEYNHLPVRLLRYDKKAVICWRFALKLHVL